MFLFNREEPHLTPEDRYNSGDIVEALNESQLNESQANTTVEGEVTQDSIHVLVLSGKFIHLKNNSIC